MVCIKVCIKYHVIYGVHCMKDTIFSYNLWSWLHKEHNLTIEWFLSLSDSIKYKHSGFHNYALGRFLWDLFALVESRRIACVIMIMCVFVLWIMRSVLMENKLNTQPALFQNIIITPCRSIWGKVFVIFEFFVWRKTLEKHWVVLVI